MATIALVLACLVCAYGRQIEPPTWHQIPTQGRAFHERSSPSSMLGAFLLAISPSIRISKFGTRMRFGQRARQTVAVVQDLDSVEAFEKAVKDAGDSLVIIDYSTSHCGPCKFMAPKFEKLSEEHNEALFYKVVGDKSQETRKLLSAQGVKAVPAFHFWKSGEKISAVSGSAGSKMQLMVDIIMANK
mmetsp:Transcript_342/g.464  ORF Transcript_342/g.464 Transcript_342/m.464 type:complete len:187 (+) Transcript_342:69-629(+)|eukprot:CAMPEP_0169168178 /NCGR_PEP_ID=MMETSP1015-20121227/60864_1 /TAXON_ID=342587 /ORGANISM="Karlodinium micrum, Strain CCMP2283" /LENGTH=186 /DNA_ID=CAMNT_0009240933 /DNA_START=68 /DNA_END=628 /DNA_ORIENTATION=+